MRSLSPPQNPNSHINSHAQQASRRRPDQRGAHLGMPAWADLRDCDAGSGSLSLSLPGLPGAVGAKNRLHAPHSKLGPTHVRPHCTGFKHCLGQGRAQPRRCLTLPPVHLRRSRKIKGLKPTLTARQGKKHWTTCSAPPAACRLMPRLSISARSHSGTAFLGWPAGGAPKGRASPPAAVRQTLLGHCSGA
jgi:hypothetical protein